MVKINISIQKKDLWLLSAIMIFLIGVGYVVAIGENYQIHGHDSDEINLPACGSGQILKYSGGIWSCQNDAGRVVQVVNTQTGAVATGTGVIPYDNTIPQITEGTNFMALSITPTSATNKLKIDVVIHLQEGTGGNTVVTAALFQNAISNALAVSFSQNGITYPDPSISFTYYMAAGTTSPTTFSVRAGRDTAGTFTFNGVNGVGMYGGALSSSITITEIQQ